MHDFAELQSSSEILLRLNCDKNFENWNLNAGHPTTSAREYHKVKGIII